MPTALKVYVNVSTNDLPRASSPGDYVEMDLNVDKIIFSNGSAIVADGLPIPSETNLTYAGAIISETVPVNVPKYFLADASAGILREIHNAGNQNKRYVVCFAFDGLTSAEPRLELWDDSSLTTVLLYSLGAGYPEYSWWKGVVTTDAAPGTDWLGTTLAGDATNRFLWLNNGAGAIPLTVAKDLYVNLKIVIPAGAGQAGADLPAFAVKWL